MKMNEDQKNIAKNYAIYAIGYWSKESKGQIVFSADYNN